MLYVCGVCVCVCVCVCLILQNFSCIAIFMLYSNVSIVLNFCCIAVFHLYCNVLVVLLRFRRMQCMMKT